MNATKRRAKRHAPMNVIGTGAWPVDAHAVGDNVTHFVVTGPRPCWAFDLAELFAAIAHAIESGSPAARAWAIAQSKTIAAAFAAE